SAAPGWWICRPGSSYRASAETAGGPAATESRCPAVGLSAAAIRAGWSELDPAQRRSVTGMTLTIVALHVLGFATLLLLVVPGGYLVDGAVFGVGLGITAYTLG